MCVKVSMVDKKDRDDINVYKFLRWLKRYVKHYKEMNICASPRVTNNFRLFKVLGFFHNYICNFKLLNVCA